MRVSLALFKQITNKKSTLMQFLLSAHRYVIALMSCFFLISCTPTFKSNRATIIHSTAYNISGGVFSHRVIYKNGQSKNDIGKTSLDPLLVFIHGDGIPWIKHYIIAKDPTPPFSLTWELFKATRLPAIFISRPCYFKRVEKPIFYKTQKTESHAIDDCDPKYWTYARYSERVVNSLHTALDTFFAQMARNQKPRDIVLVGYSGGANIALILSQRLDDVSAVVTISGNLDHNAWTIYHDYSPLVDSINASNITMNREVSQYHYLGGRDKNTPFKTNVRYFNNHSVRPIIIQNFTHQCCWIKYWPKIEAHISTR